MSPHSQLKLFFISIKTLYFQRRECDNSNSFIDCYSQGPFNFHKRTVVEKCLSLNLAFSNFLICFLLPHTFIVSILNNIFSERYLIGNYFQISLFSFPSFLPSSPFPFILPSFFFPSSFLLSLSLFIILIHSCFISIYLCGLLCTRLFVKFCRYRDEKHSP